MTYMKGIAVLYQEYVGWDYCCALDVSRCPGCENIYEAVLRSHTCG